MRTHIYRMLLITGLLVLLGGCGVDTARSNTNSDNSSTHSGGPVDISTDHSRYVVDSTIQVVVTSQLNSPVFAFDTHAGCSILSLQMSVSGQWQDSSAAPCAQARMAVPVKLAPGEAYTANIHAGRDGLGRATFPGGTYRFVLVYFSSPTAGVNGTTVYSTSFTISASGGSTPSAPSAPAPGATGPAQP